MTRICFPLATFLLCALWLSAAHAQAPSTIAYQGYLTDTDGNAATGTASVTFRLYDRPAGGTRLWQETQEQVRFAAGVFSVQLGSVESLEAVPFERSLWLGVSVGGSPELSPRTALDAMPYAMSVRGLRVVPGVSQDFNSPNLVGGYAGNVLGAGIDGAVIGGGGSEGFPNRAEARFTTIGGGENNVAASEGATVGGGRGNEALGCYDTVAGGDGNRAQTDAFGGASKGAGFACNATVGGGRDNVASADAATVGGGLRNTASRSSATVSGGSNNKASGSSAAVPGGRENQARGRNSLAAGYYARAEHEGAFVWSDNSGSSSDSLVSTGDHQFLIRAVGGVGIGTDDPQGALHVNDSAGGTDLILGGTDDSLLGDDGRLASDPRFESSDLWLISNDAVAVFLDADESGETSEFIVADGDFNVAFQVDLSGTTKTGHLELENELGAGNTPAEGGVYRDNVVYAWAHVNANGSVASSFGCTVTRVGLGRYRVDYDRALPNGMAPVVTPLSANDPVIATASPSGSNGANVVVFDFVGGQFQNGDRPFFIQVVGRP